MENFQNIFVYGTLRRGENLPLAKRLADEAIYLGEGYFNGIMHQLGSYPGVVDSDSADDQVVGDLYKIGDNPDLLDALDEYEGCTPDFSEPHEYVRVIRPIKFSERVVHAWIYIYNWDIDT